jgi:predicted dehydrogenase
MLGAPRAVQISLLRPPSASDRDSGAAAWRVRPELSGGGHFVDLGCHTLDLLGWMLGGIESVRGLAANQAGLYPAEDTVAACLRFGNGAHGVGLWCFAAGERQDRVEIVGERGSLRFSTFGDSALQLVVDGESTEETIAHPDPIQQPLIETIVSALRGEGQCPSTGETGLQTTWVIDEILQGWRSARG